MQRYEIEGLLGKGGFASVYSAFDLVARRQVALKLIDKKLMRASNSTERVRNEVEIHSRLRHPAILEVFDYFETTDFVCLVLELAELGELGSLLASKPLPDDEARDVLIQLVSALGYLHRNDIIHRDISPANLLVTADGHVKVADFGLSVHHAKGDGGTGGKATFCGTANFIAPEVVLRQPHSPSSDVWSLGCLLVFMLTGTPPFGPTAGGRRSMNEVFERVVAGKLELPKTLNPAAADLIKQMLHPVPQSRISLTEIAKHSYVAPAVSGDLLTPHRAGDTVGTDCTDISTASWPASAAGLHSSLISPRVPPRGPAALSPSPVANTTSRFTETTTTPTTGSARQLMDTARLKPAAYTVRGTTLQVLADGSFLMDLPADLAAPGHLRSVEISPDGCGVTVHESFPPTQPEAIPKAGGGGGKGDGGGRGGYTRTYTVWDMPPELSSLYDFATEVVRMLRSKTPKVVVNTRLARCMLMEDGPFPTFDVRFYSGVRLRVGPTTATFSLHNAAADTADTLVQLTRAAVLGTAATPPASPARASAATTTPSHAAATTAPTGVGMAAKDTDEEAGVPAELRDAVEHARRTFDAARKIEALHTLALGDAGFPVVVGSRDRTAAADPCASRPSETRPHLTHIAYAHTAGWAVRLSSGETWVLQKGGGQLLLSPRADKLLRVPTNTQAAEGIRVDVAGDTGSWSVADAAAAAAAADGLAAVTNRCRRDPSGTVESGLQTLRDLL